MFCSSALARRVLILPFRLLPGIMGFPERASLTTGLSTAPMAENVLEPPMCIPVITYMVAVILIFPYIFISSFTSSVY